MKTTNITDYVERYLEGKLKDGDLWEFKHNLETNEELARELKFQQEINETLSDTSKMQLRKTLKNAYLKTHYANSFASKWKFQAVAAAIVILVLAGGGLIFNKLQTSTTTNMAMYEQYFETDNALFTVRAGEMETNSFLKKGIAAFNKEDYLQAIMLFNKNSDNMAANLYSGFSFMKLSDYNNAEIKFTKIIKDNNNLFIDQAQYNLALCYLAIDKLDKVEQILQEIIKENTAYSVKAQNLLKEIENK